MSDRKIGGAEYEDADRELLNDEIPDMPIVNIRENRASDGAGGDEDENENKNKSTVEKTDREVL